MRREGYEFQVAAPQVIFQEEAGTKTEPYETLFVEVSSETQGRVMESLGARKGELQEIYNNDHTTKTTIPHTNTRPHGLLFTVYDRN